MPIELGYNNYMIMGGRNPSGNNPYDKIEIFKDGVFTLNDTVLPEPMDSGCITKINGTHIFFCKSS